MKISLLVVILVVVSAVSLRAEDSNADFKKLLIEFDRQFSEKDYSAAHKTLDKMNTLQPESLFVLNSRGAVYTEEKKLEEARKFFNAALEKEPKMFAPKFNLAEILLIEGKYADAREGFEKLIQEHPDQAEMIQFKISLTYIKEGNLVRAEDWKNKIKFPSDTPAYYFAGAALEFARNNPKEAKKWVDSSERIFNSSQNRFFIRSLQDFGWMKDTVSK